MILEGLNDNYLSRELVFLSPGGRRAHQFLVISDAGSSGFNNGTEPFRNCITWANSLVVDSRFLQIVHLHLTSLLSRRVRSSIQMGACGFT
jgi:hypothetical protein